MNLFQLFKDGPHRSHSGLPLSWKIDCDALTPDDWNCLGYLAIRLLASDAIPHSHLPSSFYPIPRGGNQLALAMDNHMSWSYAEPTYRCFADDVYTTGQSFRQYMTIPTDIGICVFARAPITSPRVYALFQMPEDMNA